MNTALWRVLRRPIVKHYCLSACCHGNTLTLAAGLKCCSQSWWMPCQNLRREKPHFTLTLQSEQKVKMRLNRGLVKCIIPPRLALWVTLVYSIVFAHAHHSIPRLYMSSLPSVKSATGGGRRTAQLFIYAGPPDITTRRQREKVFLDFWRKFEPFLDQTGIPLNGVWEHVFTGSMHCHGYKLRGESGW